MALTVEDGTGLSNADALDTLANAITYLDSLGFTSFSAGDAGDQEPAIRRASAWMSTYYRWKGSRLKGRDQALAFPRTGATDHEGESVPSDEVPIEVRHGMALAALVEFASPGSLTPQVQPNRQIKSQKIGPLAFTYGDMRRIQTDLSGVDDSRPVLSDVYDRIKGLIEIPSGVGITSA